MSRYLIVLSFLFVANVALAQSTIMVTGESTRSISPTESQLTINLNTKSSTYANAVKDLVVRSNNVSEVLNNLGFENTEIKTSNFAVNKQMRYDNGSQKEDGFLASQQLIVKFPLESKRMIEILEKVTASEARPEISISFGLDSETQSEVQEELIKSAVEDAKRKADIMAASAGYKVSGITNIVYGNIPDLPRPFQKNMMMDVASSAESRLQNFESTDLSFSESVVIVFLMEK